MTNEEEGRHLALVATISHLLVSTGSDLDEFEAHIVRFMACMPSSEDPMREMDFQAIRRSAAAELTLFLEGARRLALDGSSKRSPDH